jgi:hypothetical protein
MFILLPVLYLRPVTSHDSRDGSLPVDHPERPLSGLGQSTNSGMGLPLKAVAFTPRLPRQ